MGLQASYWNSKWDQDYTFFKRTKDIQRNVVDASTVFIKSDFVFKAVRMQNTHRQTGNSLSSAMFVKNCWKTFAKNEDIPKQCFVAATRQVLTRANQLDISDDMSLAVFCNYKTIRGVRVIKDTEFIDKESVKINDVY